MERLVRIGTGGKLWINPSARSREIGETQTAFEKLMAYENLDYSPEELVEIIERYNQSQKNDTAGDTNGWIKNQYKYDKI